MINMNLKCLIMYMTYLQVSFVCSHGEIWQIQRGRTLLQLRGVWSRKGPYCWCNFVRQV